MYEGTIDGTLTKTTKGVHDARREEYKHGQPDTQHDDVTN